MSKYFFSHSTKNKEIVEKFINALVLGKVIERDSIFCSSRPGDDIETGDRFIETIGTSLKKAEYVFCFFSRNYLDSTFCMAELGACWILEKKIFPIIIPDVDFDETTPFCRGIQGIKINDDIALNKILDKLGNNAKESTTAWEKQKKEFLKKLPELLKNNVEPNKIEYAIYTNLRQQSEKQQEEIEELKKKLRKSKQYIQKLEELKDKDAVENIKEPTDSKEKFDKLCKKVTSAFQSLPEGVALALFRENKGEVFTHNEAIDNGLDVKDAIDNDYLINNEASFELNTFSPEIEDLKKDFEKLRRFMCSDEFNDIYENIRNEYKFNPTLDNKKFWTEYLGVSF